MNNTEVIDVLREVYRQRLAVSNNLCCYLGGAVESCKDWGKMWRSLYKEYLTGHNIYAIDPIEMEGILASKRGLSTQELHALKETNPHLFNIHMRTVIAVDLALVEEADFLLVRFDGEPTAGTIHEVGHAYRLGIPCYLITGLERKNILSWFLACFDGVFHSLEVAIPIIEMEFGSV